MLGIKAKQELTAIPVEQYSFHTIYLIYIKPKLSVCVYVFAIHTRISCSVAIKLAVAAGGIGGQVIVGLTSPVLRFAESYPPISAFSFADDGHFLIIVPIDFRFLPDLIGRRPMFE